MKKIVFATNNEHKLEEARSLLSNRFEVLSLKDIGCHEELPETHDTIEENSLEKAEYVSNHYGYTCFADDTGLEVDALNGAPGVYSARYAGEGHNAEDNMNKLLREMKGKENRSARFKTVVTLVRDGETKQFTGTVAGLITTERHGKEGFGYDPIFRPYLEDPDTDVPSTLLEQTFAEMPQNEKNIISHRGRAMQKLMKELM